MSRSIEVGWAAAASPRRAGARRRRRLRAGQGARVRPAVRPHRRHADRGHRCSAPAITTTSRLVNSKGGVEGYKIRVLEIDNEYKVPPAMEAHERFKKEGAVLEGLYGTPQTAALTKKLEEDKILGTSPGFGTAAAADGKRYPLRLPDRGQLLVAGGRRGRLRQEGARRQPQGQEDRLPVLRQPGRQGAAGHPRGPRQERGLRAAGPSPCRRPASRWARRCSTSPAASSPTSSSRTCSAARRRSPSRS